MKGSTVHSYVRTSAINWHCLVCSSFLRIDLPSGQEPQPLLEKVLRAQGNGQNVGVRGVSSAACSSDGAFVLIVKGWPSAQPGEGDMGWIPASTCGMILELASIPERWLHHGSELRRQDSSFHFHTQNLASCGWKLSSGKTQPRAQERQGFKGHGLCDSPISWWGD